MLELDKSKASLKLFDDLRTSAQGLVEKLEQGDFQSISQAIEAINRERDQSIYKEVGRLTRGLHDAIVNFEVDTARYGINLQQESAEGVDGSESKMVNAKDRLDYVINLTHEAADRTMDMVEQGIPVATNLSQESKALQKDWGRLIRREMDPGEFRELYKRIDGFLAQTQDSAESLNENFNQILMAQGFQDLTGQVIKKVITLVQEVEEQLVDLVCVASQVEVITGIVGSADKLSSDKSDTSAVAEGPQINAEQRDDVVSGQDEVDDLLSSLGF